MQEHFPGCRVSYNPRDALMPERGTLSVEKAKTLLGYRPQFPLEVGFVNYIKRYKEFAALHPQLFKAPAPVAS